MICVFFLGGGGIIYNNNFSLLKSTETETGFKEWNRGVEEIGDVDPQDLGHPLLRFKRENFSPKGKSFGSKVKGKQVKESKKNLKKTNFREKNGIARAGIRSKYPKERSRTKEKFEKQKKKISRIKKIQKLKVGRFSKRTRSKIKSKTFTAKSKVIKWKKKLSGRSVTRCKRSTPPSGCTENFWKHHTQPAKIFEDNFKKVKNGKRVKLPERNEDIKQNTVISENDIPGSPSNDEFARDENNNPITGKNYWGEPNPILRKADVKMIQENRETGEQHALNAEMRFTRDKNGYVNHMNSPVIKQQNSNNINSHGDGRGSVNRVEQQNPNNDFRRKGPDNRPNRTPNTLARGSNIEEQNSTNGDSNHRRKRPWSGSRSNESRSKRSRF